MLLPTRSTDTGTFSVLQQLVFCAREDLAHRLQISDSHVIDLDTEGADGEGLRVAVCC